MVLMLSNTPHKPLNTRASLLLRLRSDAPGRDVAWVEFYDLYAPIISGFARRMGATRDQADDLVQEVIRAFFAVSPEFAYDPSRGRFRGYLKTCVWHKWNELRRKHGQEAAALSELARQQVTDSVDATWNDVWETEKLQRALAAVRERYSTSPERQRTFLAFEMSALLERPTEQIAGELGMTSESVRAAKSRISKAVRQEFDALDETTG